MLKSTTCQQLLLVNAVIISVLSQVRRIKTIVCSSTVALLLLRVVNFCYTVRVSSSSIYCRKGFISNAESILRQSLVFYTQCPFFGTGKLFFGIKNIMKLTFLCRHENNPSGLMMVQIRHFFSITAFGPHHH